MNETSLDVLADAARAAGRIALDTEFMGEGRYRTLLCLVQLAIPEDAGTTEHIAVIDPLDEELEHSPLADVLADLASAAAETGRTHLNAAEHLLTGKFWTQAYAIAAFGFEEVGKGVAGR